MGRWGRGVGGEAGVGVAWASPVPKNIRNEVFRIYIYNIYYIFSTYIYIYIYLCMYIQYTYIYICILYIFVYVYEREKDRERERERARDVYVRIAYLIA